MKSHDWQPIGDHGFEKTWLVQSNELMVVKAIALKPEADVGLLRLPSVDHVPPWTQLQRADASQVAEAGLDGAKEWVFAWRTHIPGHDLLACVDNVNTLPLAAELTTILRDLHETGIIHGDIQPRNVIVDEAVWLIDVSLSDAVEGHVAGSAALMAPELWSSSAPTPASDVYALASLLVWCETGDYPLSAEGLASWAQAHQSGTPTVPESLPSPVAGVLKRMLDRDPSQRPPLQHLLDALASEGQELPTARVAVGLAPYAQVVSDHVQQADSGAVICLEGPEQSVRAVLKEIRLHLEFQGWRSHSMQPQLDGPPWSSVLALVDDLGGAADIDLRGGDQLHVFETLTHAVLSEINRPTLVTFIAGQTANPDLRAWWLHLVDSARREGTPVAFLTDIGEVATPIPKISPADWSKWRANTLRSDVRDISQKRWDQLVATHGDYLESMTRALNLELGLRPAVEETRAFDTAGLVAIGKGWKPRVEALIQQCAFGEAVTLCEAIHDSLQTRTSSYIRGLPDAMEVLALWTEAMVKGTRTRISTEKLEVALAANAFPQSKILLARLHHSLGRHTEGLAALEELRPGPNSGFDHNSAVMVTEVLSWCAQLALSLGQFDEAAAYSRQGLEILVHHPDVAKLQPEVVAHLEVMVRAPDALRGKSAAIDGLKDLLPDLEGSEVPAILRARAHSYRAIGLSRNSAFDQATDAYLRALEEIEAAGLTGELPTYLLNVGTAYHRQGRLGLAREYYARGTRVAQPTTRASTRALLLANQANVDLALGRLEETRSLVDRALAMTRQHGLPKIEIMCLSLLADSQLAENNPDEAYQQYHRLLQRADLSPAQRAEVLLASAEAAMAQGDPALPLVQSHLDHARALIDESRLSDLEHHHGILRARFQWSEGGDLGVMAGIELFRRHLLGARDAGNHKLVLRESPYLVEQLEREALTDLLDEILEIVQSSRNAIAMGLTRELRRDFFATLPSLTSPRERPAPTPVVATQVQNSPEIVERFYRMLSLNEVILRTDSQPELFESALDIAMSLSGAERSFILLREVGRGRVGDFKVAASRDVGGDAIPKPHLKVSLTIAEEAARTGRTVVTLNAKNDDRFDSALSVVDLDLTSVLCVPIRDASGLLGALYLDHRFRPGVFGGEVPRMMEEFGHQLALGISNARRLELLKAEQAKLEAANQELDALLQERDLMMRGLEQRVSQLANQVEQQNGNSLRDSFHEIAFASHAMEVVLDQVSRVSRGDIPVVVMGESGVGKELIARAIHQSSPRSGQPFVAFNCGAVSETLFESEMFGHVRGAFTGADFDRDGLFLSASGGTIFLDEVGEMPPQMQVKLLRVLQEKQIRRVGEAQTRPVDVRVVAATNRDLWEMVEAKTFRQDLYFRLAAFSIRVPALRERREDIPLIAQKVLERMGEETGTHARLTPQGARLLAQCEWVGNVRQLENTLRTAVVLSQAEELGEAELAPLIQLRGQKVSRSTTSPRRGRKAKATRQDVVEAMRRAQDDRDAAADILGVSVRTLFRYLAKYNI